MHINDIPPGTVFVVAGEDAVWLMGHDRSVHAHCDGLSASIEAVAVPECFRGLDLQPARDGHQRFHPSIAGVDGAQG